MPPSTSILKTKKAQRKHKANKLEIIIFTLYILAETGMNSPHFFCHFLDIKSKKCDNSK